MCAQINLTGSVGLPGSSAILGSADVVFATDANHTLLASEFSNKFLAVSGTISTTRNLIGPLNQGQEFVIENNTSGGQAIQIIGATGTGISIPNGQVASVVCDGTNYLQPSASITFAGDLTGSNTSQTVVGIQAVAVSATAPSTGYLLTATSSTAADWQAAPTGFTAGGDLSGTSTSQQVDSITGSGGLVSIGATIQGNSSPVSYSIANVSMSSDANLTLSSSQYNCPILRITSSVNLTTTRNIVLPAVSGASYSVYNGTSGAPGQSLQFIASSGTGVTVPNGLKTTVYFDGTNYVTGGTVIGGDLSATSNVSQTVAKIQGNPVLSQSLSSGQDGYVLSWIGTEWEGLLLPATDLVGGSAQYTNATTIGAIQSSQLVIGMLAYDQATAITYQLTSLTPGNGFANGTWSPVVIPVAGAFSPGAATVATSNITLSGEQTINTILTNLSRVLVVGQTNPDQNGLYLSSPSAWSYTSDGNVAADYVVGKQISIDGGTYAGNIYIVTTVPATLGSNPLNFVSNAAGGGSSIVGGDLSGTTASATVTKITGPASATLPISVQSSTWTPSSVSNLVVSETPYSVQTTNATATTIATIATSSGYSYRVDALVMTLQAVDGYADVLSNTHAGLFSNVSGTLTQQGATLNGVALGTTGGLTWPGLTMAVSSTNILVKVTGASSTTINWLVQIRLTVTT